MCTACDRTIREGGDPADITIDDCISVLTVFAAILIILFTI